MWQVRIALIGHLLITTQLVAGCTAPGEGRHQGSYHKISAKYLPLYVTEFQFHYNNRKNEDIFGADIRGC
jgi:hypothetical protein